MIYSSTPFESGSIFLWGSNIWSVQKGEDNGVTGSVKRVFRQTQEEKEAAVVKYCTSCQSTKSCPLKGEADVLASLRDVPGAVQIYGLAKVQELYPLSNHSGYCIFMEDAGMSLSKYITEYAPQGMKHKEVQVVAKMLFEYLSASFKKGILHGDIKLDNVCWKNGEAKVVDLGRAVTRDRLLSGKRDYILYAKDYSAPEWTYGLDDYFRAQNVDLLFKGEMWAAGCVLYAAYTGDNLFSAEWNPWLRFWAKREGSSTIIPITDSYMQVCSFSPYDLMQIPRAIPPSFERLIPFIEATAAHLPEDLKAGFKETNSFYALLSRIFVIDPRQRISPEEALESDFLREDFEEMGA